MSRPHKHGLVFVCALLGAASCFTSTADAQKNRFPFPGSLGEFKREGAVKRDPGGNPMATYYAGRLVVLDMYYYKDQLPFSGEFARCRDYVKIVHSDARMVDDTKVRLHGEGRRAVFVFKDRLLGGPKIPLRSELLLFPQADRFLKFRITYPADHAGRARAEIDSFIRSLPSS